MDLPPTLFYNLAEMHPLIVQENKIFTLLNNDSELDFYSKESPISKVEECEALDYVEKFYFFDNEGLIKKIMSDFVLKTKPKDGSEIKEDIFDLKKRYKLVSFIVDDVFPFHLKTKKTKKYNNTISAKLKKNKNKLLQILELGEPRDKKNDDLFLDLIGKKHSFLYDLLKDKSLFVYEKNIYDFVPVSKKTSMRINEQYYDCKFIQKLDDFEKNYKSKITEGIKKISVGSHESLLRQTNFLLDQKKHLEDIINKNAHQEKDIGFKKINSSEYYIFLQLEPYVLQELSDEKYFKFGNCKAAVRVSYNNGNISWDWPIVLEKYSHPALPDIDQSKQYICVGKKKHILNEIKDKTLPEQVHNVLFRGEKALHTGHFNKETLVPHKQLYNSCFDNHEISKYDIIRQGLVVTNIKNSKKVVV